jgi:hypothetical protein
MFPVECVGSFKIHLKYKPSVWRANPTQVSLAGAGRHRYVAIFVSLCLALAIPLRYGLMHVRMIVIKAVIQMNGIRQLLSVFIAIASVKLKIHKISITVSRYCS